MAKLLLVLWVFFIQGIAWAQTCALDPGDCNREGVNCACKSKYVAVARPLGMEPVPCALPEIAKLQEEVRVAVAVRDTRLLQLLKSVLDAACPDAFAQVTHVNCMNGMCANDILTLCSDTDATPGCVKTVTYPGGGTQPLGCVAIPMGCQITVSCEGWTTTPTSSERTCTIDDPCFGQMNACFPYNHQTFGRGNSAALPPVVQRGHDEFGQMSRGSQVCVPDCEAIHGVGSGLRYIFSGPNRGKCACAIGMVWNPLMSRCESPTVLTGCNEGSSTLPPSEVSPYTTGEDYVERFRNTINKKLACCLNGSPKNAASAKFDCTDNSYDAYADFNELWASVDATNGGQLNAIYLMGGDGRPVSGFYSLKGQRAPQFSEFSRSEIRAGILNARVKSGQVQQISGEIDYGTHAPLPKPSGPVWDDLVSRLGDLRVPTTAAERREFPLLVRAAAIYRCPKNPLGIAPPRTLETLSGATVVGAICPTAATVTIYVRVEQVWTVAGTPPMRTIDTMLDEGQASSFSVEKLLMEKYGPGCPPGSFPQGNGCVW